MPANHAINLSQTAFVMTVTKEAAMARPAKAG
ncbi:MAG: hypothetical protein ACI82A_004241, partial [Candidatus Azotimanducaceae bacterium]